MFCVFVLLKGFLPFEIERVFNENRNRSELFWCVFGSAVKLSGSRSYKFEVSKFSVATNHYWKTC